LWNAVQDLLFLLPLARPPHPENKSDPVGVPADKSPNQLLQHQQGLWHDDWPRRFPNGHAYGER
jgi:hypothetical protein